MEREVIWVAWKGPGSEHLKRMKQSTKTSLIALMILSICSGCVGQGEPYQVAREDPPDEASSAQPYAGLEDRSIKALSEERVEDLLAGRGAGYALAAELNHYPGPAHVLELGGDLKLSAEQQRAVRGIHSAMQDEAKSLGRKLVDLETQLDESFRNEDIDEEKLTRLTGEIADVEGRLRETHLAAHLKTKDILTSEQIAEYDRLRGYAGNDGTEPVREDQHESGDHDAHG